MFDWMRFQGSTNFQAGGSNPRFAIIPVPYKVGATTSNTKGFLALHSTVSTEMDDLTVSILV